MAGKKGSKHGQSQWSNYWEVGQKVGKWTILDNKVIFGKHSIALISCKCECGTEKLVPALYLTKATARTGCNNKIHLVGKAAYNWTGYESLYGSYVSHIKKMGKRREIRFEIDSKIMWEQFQKQNGRCALTGEKLDITYKTGNASLDRIDSKGHYTVDNIQWVLKSANIIKRELSQEQFIDLCYKIADYQRKLKIYEKTKTTETQKSN